MLPYVLAKTFVALFLSAPQNSVWQYMKNNLLVVKKSEYLVEAKVIFYIEAEVISYSCCNGLNTK